MLSPKTASTFLRIQFPYVMFCVKMTLAFSRSNEAAPWDVVAKQAGRRLAPDEERTLCE